MARLFKPTASLFDLICIVLMYSVVHLVFEELWLRIVTYLLSGLMWLAISAKGEARYWRPPVRK